MAPSTFRFFLGAALLSAVTVASPISYSAHPTPCTVTLPTVDTVEPSMHPVYSGDIDEQVQPSIAPIYPGDIEPSMEPSQHPVYPGDIEEEAEPSAHPVYPGDVDDQVEPSAHPVYPGDIDNQVEPSAHPVYPGDVEYEIATPTPTTTIPSTKRCHFRNIDLENRSAERCCNVRYSCSSAQCNGSSACKKPHSSFCRKPVCKKVFIHYSLVKELSGNCGEQML